MLHFKLKTSPFSSISLLSENEFFVLYDLTLVGIGFVDSLVTSKKLLVLCNFPYNHSSQR